MTISSQTRTAGPFLGTGLMASYPFTFKVFQGQDVLVVKTNASGAQVTLALSTDYTVTLNADQNAAPGGVVSVIAALPAGFTLNLTSNIPVTQSASLTNAGGFFPKTIEDALDRLTILMQQQGFTSIGQSLRIPEIGGVPTIAPLASRANNLLGFDSAGNPVAVAPANGSAASLATDLTSTALATKGAGQVGFLYSLGYGAGTVGKWLKDLATSAGSSFVGFINSGTGAISRSAQDRLRESISVKDFGAVGDGVTDDTAAIQSAIVYAAALYPANNWFSNIAYSAPRVVDFPSAIYKVAGKLLVPNGIVLRGNQSTLTGTGNTATDNTCFETAYFLAGVLTSNIGTPVETQRVQYTRIEGFKLINFKTAINLYNFNEGCAVRDCAFYNCYQNLIADRCFYASFVNLGSREAIALAAAVVPAYDFRNFVNVEQLESIFCTNRVLGIQFSGGVNGLALRNCTVESGTTGIKFTGNVNPMNIDSCYFEGLTGAALDFSAGGGTNAITIDNNWFNLCGTGILGANMLGGRIGRGNYFIACATNVSILDNVSTIRVEMPTQRITDAGSLLPAMPAKFALGIAVVAEQFVQIYGQASGNVTAIQQFTANSYTPLPFSGNQGFVPGKVAFCDHSKTAGTTFNVLIDSKIALDPYTMFVFSLVLTDNAGSYTISGRGYGTTVYFDAASTKALTASSNAGYLRLTVTGLVHPASTYTCEGILRIV